MWWQHKGHTQSVWVRCSPSASEWNEKAIQAWLNQEQKVKENMQLCFGMQQKAELKQNIG